MALNSSKFEQQQFAVAVGRGAKESIRPGRHFAGGGIWRVENMEI